MNPNYFTVCFIVLYVGVNLASAQNFLEVITPLNSLSVNSRHNEILAQTSGDTCPTLENAELLTQTQLIRELTAPCRYDRLDRPYVHQDGSIVDAPVNVYVRVHVNVLQNLDASNLQLSLHGLVQFRFNDPRLAFGRYAPLRDQNLVGDSSMRSLIWVPKIFLANEHDSSVLGTNEKDKLTTISPDGTVIISSRIQATVFCWMNLQKFPFDEQFCPTVLKSWMYNASELLLRWEQNTPITFDPKMEMTEFVHQGTWTDETVVNADLDDRRNGAFAGQYSSLSFTVHLTREVGHYITDYFIPSIIIVAISWLTFMLKGDQTSARSTIGSTTMVAFITLASRQETNLPKVTYLKISEVWFIVCILFIFCSIVEFAIVYNVWYRKHSVVVPEVKSKYILKSILTTGMDEHEKVNASNKLNSTDSIATSSNSNAEPAKNKSHSCTMTPQELSLWIDKKARWVFPLVFLIFNILFWTLVYVLD